MGAALSQSEGNRSVFDHLAICLAAVLLRLVEALHDRGVNRLSRFLFAGHWVPPRLHPAAACGFVSGHRSVLDRQTAGPGSYRGTGRPLIAEAAQVHAPVAETPLDEIARPSGAGSAVAVSAAP